MSTAALPVEISDEPLVGWRCWFVLPEEGLLRPIYKRGLVWKPREALQALCPEELHEIPAENCKCGVWTVCHPMLLDEIGWTSAPPQGIGKLPGVMVVGEVSLWGKILQHERGWRASCAYPRHLYAFTDDALLAETLRERYGVPVEWGQDAERLRRLLPAHAAEPEQKEPELREVLLDVLRTGLCPKALEELVSAALGTWDHRTPVEDRIKKAQADLNKAAADERGWAHWRLAIAVADRRALEGDGIAARRVLWVRLARWQRQRGQELLDKRIAPCLRERDELLEDLARGTARGGRHRGQRYSAPTLAYKRERLAMDERQLADQVPHIETLLAVPIPTYREWCAIARGVVLSPSPATATPSEKDLREWHRQAMRREQELARQEHDIAVARRATAVDRETFERDVTAAREALERERAALRDDVVAGVQRDHAALLEDVGALERRRRAALAMLPGTWPQNAGPKARSLGAGHPALAARLQELGIPQARVAELAGCSRSLVSSVFAGRAVGRRGRCATVAAIAERLVADAEARQSPTMPAQQEDESPPPPAVSLRNELDRGRAELNELRQQATTARAAAAEERRRLDQDRRHLEAEAKARDRAASIEYARRAAASLRPRLEAAGITLTQVARAARVEISQVSHVLAGRCSSTRVVAAAEQLLANKR